jgi:hypothetical protein
VKLLTKSPEHGGLSKCLRKREPRTTVLVATKRATCGEVLRETCFQNEHESCSCPSERWVNQGNIFVISLVTYIEVDFDEFGNVVGQFLPRDGVVFFPVIFGHNLSWHMLST